MNQTESLAATTKSKFKLLHALAAILGVTVGLLLLPRGMRGFFSVGINDNLFTIIGLVTSGFSLIPLSLLGILRPQLAGKLILVSVILFLTSSFLYVTEKRASSIEISYDFTLLKIFVPPAVVVGALFYKSDKPMGNQPEGNPDEGSEI